MRNLFDRFYKAIAVILLFTGTVFAQNYMWPTNASEYLSSSFCEYRDGHYHSAIDVKTWNTEGYPCYAVADGYIKRIRISPFGYGKVLYLQLTDGRTAVYAHLQKFPREIEKQIISSQYENKQYRLDWWPKNLKVKKGDIIAYTGRTGIGVPHLHFEIRNRKDNPINPLKFYSQVKDGIRPKLIELAVIPISENATVNGTFLPARYPLHYIKDGLYVITEPVYASGKIGLAIHGYDQADDVYNKYGFNQSTLEVAGDSVFQITYDELDFSWTGHIDTELYYPLLKTERKRFNKLYLEPFNPMTFYNRSFKKDGTIQMSETPVPFTVTVSDFMNNRSIIRGEILPAGAYSIRIVHASRENDWLYVKF
ncbi:MAG: M23 family metallopeptidase, partial [Calditrichales bacterium]